MKSFSLVKKLIIVTIALATVFVATVECATCAYMIGEKVQVKLQVEEGQKELEVSNYRGAIEKFKEAISNDPYNVDAYWGVACAYVGLKEYDSAISVLSEADVFFSKLCEGTDVSSARDELKVRIDQVKECKLEANNS